MATDKLPLQIMQKLIAQARIQEVDQGDWSPP